MLCCLSSSWTKVKVKNVDPLNSTGSLQIATSSPVLLVIGFVEWINLLGCWLNQDCTLPWIRNKDYHLMHGGVKPAFIKVWSILTHPIFKCCDLTSLKSYFTIVINLYKKLNPNISSTCNFNCFANILQMTYWFLFFCIRGESILVVCVRSKMLTLVSHWSYHLKKYTSLQNFRLVCALVNIHGNISISIWWWWW